MKKEYGERVTVAEISSLFQATVARSASGVFLGGVG